MIEPSSIAGLTRVGERVVVHGNSRSARWFSALAVLVAGSWLVLLVTHSGYPPRPQIDEILWPFTVVLCVGFIARGIFLGRPVTYGHAAWASLAVIASVGAHILLFGLLANAFVVAAGVLLMWPTNSRPQPEMLPVVVDLIAQSPDDPLAVFAMHSLKSYYFNTDKSAAIAYRTRAGLAVVSGDPLGDETQFASLVAGFVQMCHVHGWRIAVLCSSERRLPLWTGNAAAGHGLRAVPIGHDVVIDVGAFDMVGRQYRNLRQAVQRTRNSGITTEIVDEQGLDGRLRAELLAVIDASHSGRTERGFAMILDGALVGRYPGIRLALARDRDGVVQGFHRYASAGGGKDISLDVPWRRPGAPNGIDERISIDMINVAKSEGAQRLSLAFAAFPELFAESDRTPIRQLMYSAVHLLDPLIALESLYRYLRKFHSLGERRYAVVPMTALPLVAYALLTLEFAPRARRR